MRAAFVSARLRPLVWYRLPRSSWAVFPFSMILAPPVGVPLSIMFCCPFSLEYIVFRGGARAAGYAHLPVLFAYRLFRSHLFLLIHDSAFLLALRPRGSPRSPPLVGAVYRVPDDHTFHNSTQFTSSTGGYAPTNLSSTSICASPNRLRLFASG